MPPKREVQLVQALERGDPINYNHRSGIARIGGIALTNSRGTATPLGRRYQQLAESYERSPDLDPWNRGTQTRGLTEYATTRSGAEHAVGRWRNGKLLATAGYGEKYYGQFREEFILHVPVLRYIKHRN